MFDFSKELKSHLQKKFMIEHYWRNYLRNEDAQRTGIKRPYHNLEEYFKWKKSQEEK